MKMKRNDLIVINDLVRAKKGDYYVGIDKYIIEFNKKEKALFVEQFDPKGIYLILLRKEMENITKDELIPIADSIYFGDILSKIIEEDEIDLFVEDNKVIIKTSNKTIGMSYFEEDEEEVFSRESTKSAFKTRKHGEEANMLTFYMRENEEDPNPDAKCKIDLKRLNIENISNIFDTGETEIGAKKGNFYITIGDGKQKKAHSIRTTIKKERDKDLMNVKGECSALLQSSNCLSILAEFSGFTYIEMKKEFPLVIKKKILEHDIGICYLVSLLEELDDDEIAKREEEARIEEEKEEEAKRMRTEREHKRIGYIIFEKVKEIIDILRESSILY